MKKILKPLVFSMMMSLPFISCIGAEGDYNYSDEQNKKPLSGNPKAPVTNSLTKRGICYNSLTPSAIQNLTASGKVTWAYNWGNSSGNSNIGPNKPLVFAPMAWNTDASAVRNIESYLKSNPGVELILGYNEPNMSGKDGGCATTPQIAAQTWHQLEELADKYNVKLGSPAMTYSSATVGGKVYGTPEAWMDEFIRYYQQYNNGKSPRFDYFVLHSYMNWTGGVENYINTYAKMYNRPVLLTEFCSWEYGGDEWSDISKAMNKSNNHFQNRQMVQKLEMMDHNDYVAGYNWFMADGSVSSLPWNSLIDSDKESLTLTGKIYANLSNGNGKKYWKEGEIIPCYEYVSSSNYDLESAKPYDQWFDFEESTEASSSGTIPLQISNFARSRYVKYQIDSGNGGSYKLTLNYKSSVDQSFEIYTGQTKIASKSIPSTGNKWTRQTFDISLPAGTQTIKILATGKAHTDNSIAHNSVVDVNFNYVYFSKDGSANTGNLQAGPASVPKANESAVNADIFNQNNKAKNTTATASSGNAELAVDGNTTSRWESTHGVDPSWIAVDLGSAQKISKVGFMWENARAATYEIQTSNDGNTWETQCKVTNGDSLNCQITLPESVTARHVRMYGTSRTTGYGYSIFEIGIWE